MKAEKGCISRQDLIFSVFCFMQGTMLRSGFVTSVTRNDSWAMAFTGLLCMVPIIAIYVGLVHRFPGKSLMEIDDIVFGPVLGKIVSVLYLFFFLSLCALNTRDLGNFIVGYSMTETPLAAVVIFFLLVCVYSVRKGIENLMRLSVLFCIIVLAAVTLNFILVLRDVQFDFLKPFFKLSTSKYVQGTLTVAAVPMGEILTFLMIVPLLKNNRAVGKPLLIGLTASAVFMGVVMLRDIITLGPLVSVVSLASFESVRYVSLAGILTRMESLYGTMQAVLFFFKVSLLLYAFVIGVGQLLKLKNYLRMTMISGALVAFYSLLVFESVMENMDWGASTAPFFSLSFEFILPGITLLTAVLRKKNSAVEVKT